MNRLFGLAGRVVRRPAPPATGQGEAEVSPDAAVLLQAMFERSPVATLRVRMSGGTATVAAANAAFARVVGLSLTEVLGRSLRTWVATEDEDRLEPIFAKREDRWSPQVEVRLHTRVGVDRQVVITATALEVTPSDPDVTEFLVHVEDVTARRAAEDAVAWYSLFDAGTGLLNRTALGDRLDGALHRLRAQGGPLGLIALDIDDFKTVNDTLGHVSGDQVLATVGERLRVACVPGAVVARLGGDEFAVLVEGETDEAVAVLVGRLQQALTQPLLAVGEEVILSVCIGAAVVNDTHITAGEVIRQAELALFRAKRSGRGRIEFYAASMRDQEQAALDVRKELLRAISGESFVVAYQPIVDLADGSVKGHEALVRLPAADGRLLVPGEFIEVARNSGLLSTMDELVLRRALSDHASGRPAAGTGLSVNAEPEDLRDPDFALSVLAHLHAAQFDPTRLTVEVTEADLLEFDDVVQSNISALREAGICFAVDDFGTGYSSLAQLRQLNADILKIDRSFVSGMEDDPEARNIVGTIISLAHRLNLVTVAEGIETREQAELLRRMGCVLGQGYLFGRPQVPADADMGLPAPRPSSDVEVVERTER